MIMDNEILNLKNNSAIQSHINMMQGMINRMANNSANCKIRCITILSAIFALFCDKKLDDIDFCYFIAALFCFLDCFYLGLERLFIKEQSKYIELINSNDVDGVAKQTYIPYSISPKKGKDENCFIENLVKKI